MQIKNPYLDDFARVMSGALGVAAGIRGEVEALIRQRVVRLLGEMELVSREEFDAVKAMAAKARTEQEGLAARLEALEAGRASGPQKKAATPRAEAKGAPAGTKKAAKKAAKKKS